MDGLGLKVTVHPLFFVLGFWYAATGRILEFVVYTVTAVIHELGHSAVAAGRGYRLNKMVLMPFGAMVRGSEKISPYDEIAIAAAGPCVNVAVGVLFVAVWWVFPNTYAYTDVAAVANFSMATINMLPAYPLDGGRILGALIARRAGENAAFAVCRLLGAGVAVVLAAIFVISCFSTPNVSLMCFALFVISGALSREKDNIYVRAYTGVSERRLRRGVPIRRVAISEKSSIGQLVRALDPYSINEVSVYSNGKKKAALTQSDLEKIIESANLRESIEKFINV